MKAFAVSFCALLIFEKLLFAQDVSGLFDRAKKEYEAQRYQLAEQLFQDGLEKDAQNQLALLYFARLAERLGRDNSVIRERYRKARDVSPSTANGVDAHTKLRELEMRDASHLRLVEEAVGKCYQLNWQTAAEIVQSCFCINKAYSNADGKLAAIDIQINNKSSLNIDVPRVATHNWLQGIVRARNVNWHRLGTTSVVVSLRNQEIVSAHPNSYADISRNGVLSRVRGSEALKESAYPLSLITIYGERVAVYVSERDRFLSPTVCTAP